MPGEFSRTVVKLASSFQRRAAAEQGGLLSGTDPTKFTDKDPIRLWIIQVGIIILTAQLLGALLRRIRQPKVIAEVLGGILLGPTAFGRIPGFTKHIFPDESLPYLSLVANIGLVLFLFIVGLEIETSVIKKNARYSMPIALGGMVLPFGLGAALAVPIYNRYINIEGSETSYTHFMLFAGVAFSITAFPVLCRILTELKLVDTTVGIVVLSAGVGNDIIGWTLLALAVALVNASSGLSALWILLTAVAWTLFLLIPVRRFFKWLAQYTGSIENGPTMTFMTATILMTFGSAFFTDVIGVHAIFGGFLAGLVVPREGNLAITLTEKLEDMVSIIFLPLYFTLSGLSTNLGLLNDGQTWGFTIAICALAYFGKFFGCSVAAKLCGFSIREASTIGSLMSCKGLVELIVLNVGLSAGILSSRVFAMFVFEALLLTFLTTPAVLALYPEGKRTRVWDAGADYHKPEDEKGNLRKESTEEHDAWKTRFTVVLDKLEHLPGMMTLTQLIHPISVETKKRLSGTVSNEKFKSTVSSSSATAEDPGFSFNALRLIELSDRTSAVMRASEADQLIHTDPLLNVFKTFGILNGFPILPSLSVVTFGDLATRVADRAQENGSDLVLVPWLPPSANGAHEITSTVPATPSAPVTPGHGHNTSLNPFDMLFGSAVSDTPKAANPVHSQFVRGVFAQCHTDVAVYVDRTRSKGPTERGTNQHHIFLPFFGGPDDRLALEFVIQLCSNTNVSATVLMLTKEGLATEEVARPEAAHVLGVDEQASIANISIGPLTTASCAAHHESMRGPLATVKRMQSESEDKMLWERYTRADVADYHAPRVAKALSRVKFEILATSQPVHAVIEAVNAKSGSGGRVHFVVLGRSRRLMDHCTELKKLGEEHGNVDGEVRKTIGDVAAALVAVGCEAGLVVLQAAKKDD